MKVQTLFIGVDGEKAVTSGETKKQIDRVKALECALQHGTERLTWDTFDNPDEPRTLFQSILGDRGLRIDKGTPMADRPSFVVVTAIDGKAVRLEYYEGHDALSLVYDVRSKELEGKDLPDYMGKDPQTYDPVAFLSGVFGIPEEVSRPILDKAHKRVKGD